MFFCVYLVFFASFGRVLIAEHMMIGQPQDVLVNNTNVLKAARFAVVEFNRANTDHQFDYKIVNITSAKIQVVAGLNYILDVLLGRTMCKTDSSLCELRCHFIVTDVPWEHFRTLSVKKCHFYNVTDSASDA
uniref:Cystatin-like n=1 Tax=Labrus bergylta TaxID=56723 RepID=A0A3Q3ETA3_9LABR